MYVIAETGLWVVWSASGSVKEKARGSAIATDSITLADSPATAPSTSTYSILRLQTVAPLPSHPSKKVAQLAPNWHIVSPSTDPLWKFSSPSTAFLPQSHSGSSGSGDSVSTHIGDSVGSVVGVHVAVVIKRL